MELESKALTGPDITSAFDEFLRAFEAFKSANDERLAQLEKRSADVVTEDKVDRINKALAEHGRALDELTLAAARPAIAGERKAAAAPREQKAAFERYVRTGDASGLFELKTDPVALGSTAASGYIVPAEVETTIDRVVAKASPMRRLATVRQIGGASYRKPVATAGAAAGWVAETTARLETDAPTLMGLDFPTMELYAMPAATQALLDDSAVDLEQWLADEVQIVFAEQEGAAFIAGNGTSAPKGFLSETTVDDANWQWGKLGFVDAGAAAFPAQNPADLLVSLAYAPRQGYRAGGSWLMNRKTESLIRKFKDEQDNYIWQPGTAAGQPATLLGYPVAEADDMPDVAAGNYPIAFGDFARGYLIVDRLGIKVLRDPYSAKPYVLFYTTKRVGGGVQNFEAIKLLKFSAAG